MEGSSLGELDLEVIDLEAGWEYGDRGREGWVQLHGAHRELGLPCA